MYRGEWVVVFWIADGAENLLGCVGRFEEQDDRIARIITYYYCADTIREFAAEIGAGATPPGQGPGGYHQTPDVLAQMIAAAVLPWAAP